MNKRSGLSLWELTRYGFRIPVMNEKKRNFTGIKES